MEGSYNKERVGVLMTSFYHLGKWKGAITSGILGRGAPAFYHLGKWKGAITSRSLNRSMMYSTISENGREL